MRCFFTALSEAVSAVFCTDSVRALSDAVFLSDFHSSALHRFIMVSLLTPCFAASSLKDEPPIYSALMAFQSALIAHHPFNGVTSLQALAEAQGVEPRYIGSKPIALPLCYASKTKKTDFSVFLKFHDSIISRMVQKSVSICGQSVSSFRFGYGCARACHLFRSFLLNT